MKELYNTFKLRLQTIMNMVTHSLQLQKMNSEKEVNLLLKRQRLSERQPQT